MGFSRDLMASNLRALRAYRGVSQDAAAEGIGISSSMLQFYEAGKSIPSYETAWKIADYYGVSIDAIGGRNGGVIAV